MGKWLYGAFFLVVFPALLVLWSYFMADISWPPVHSPGWGLGLGLAGLLLMVWGMYALWRYGRGLPMNAYPPTVYVDRGPYRWLRHPIYWGFGIFLVGASIYLGWAAALWVVTPVTILGMIALVWGYERLDLAERFPGRHESVLLDLPSNTHEPPRRVHRLVSLFWTLALWLVGGSVFWFLSAGTAAAVAWPWPVKIPFSLELVVYGSWLFIVLMPFLAREQGLLRAWAVTSLAGTATCLYLAFLWPEVMGPFFTERPSPGMPATGFISLVAIPAPVFWLLITGRAYARTFPKLKVFTWLLTFVLAILVISIDAAPWLHLLTGILVFLFAINLKAIWSGLRWLAEKIANSWREWVFGPVRIINHGIYIGVGAFLGAILIGGLAGEDYAWGVALFAFITIVFSAIWAQVIEGSEKLKRPYGYYGGLVGVSVASLVVWLAGYNVWVILGGFSVAMTWVQAIGRLRCLINGCCHGAPTDNAQIGIRYYHPRSRVCGLSMMKGVSLHPTPLYAIIWLFLIGFVQLKLWLGGAGFPFIVGTYLILTGLGRFVEEAYRGEVQTPMLYGLRLYQWTAIISILAGIIMTLVDVPRPPLEPEFGWKVIWAALAIGVFTFFAMGVDFPKSNARFSRLV